MSGETQFYVKVALLAVALITGFVAGRWLHTGPESGSVGRSSSDVRGGRPPPQPAPGNGVGSNPGTDVPISDGDLQILRDRVGEHENELRMARAAKELYEQQLFGDPIPWPETIPEAFQPGVFQRTMGDVMQDCEAELVGFECDEPPCIAMLRGDDPQYLGPLLERCPGWAEQFGERSSGLHTNIDCDDGRSERVYLVSPSPFGVLFADDDEVRTNFGKRRRLRYQQIELDWECVPQH